MPGLKKFLKLHSDKMQNARCSYRPALGDVAPLSHHSKPGHTLEILTGNPGPIRMVAAIFKTAKQLLGQGSTTPARATLNLVQPNGADITNTIEGAELAAIAAAFTHIHIAPESLTSLHQTRNQLLHPEKHRHHVQEGLLKILSHMIQSFKSHIFHYRVKSHARIAEMNVQTPLQNTEPAMEAASQLKQPSAPQALVAIPSLILAGLLLKELISKNLALKLPNRALD